MRSAALRVTPSALTILRIAVVSEVLSKALSSSWTESLGIPWIVSDDIGSDIQNLVLKLLGHELNLSKRCAMSRCLELRVFETTSVGDCHAGPTPAIGSQQVMRFQGRSACGDVDPQYSAVININRPHRCLDFPAC